MSVNHNNDKNQPPQSQSVIGDALRQAGITGNQFSSQQEQPQMTQTQPPQPIGSEPTAFNVNSVLRRPVSRAPAGERTSGIVKALKKLTTDVVTDQELRSAIDFQILDSNSDQVLMSTILVAMYVNHSGAQHAGVFELIVEDPSVQIADLVRNNGYNMQTVVKRVTGDLANDELWNKARNAIVNRTAVKEGNVHFAGSMVIPATLAVDDESHLRALLFTSTQAIFTVLEDEVVGGEPSLALKGLLAKSTLSVVLDYAAGNAETATGLPIRSNLSVILKASETGADQQSLHRKSAELTRIDGFVDFILNPPPPPAYGQAPKTQYFNPRFVITRADSCFDAITLESQLLALSTAFTASYNYAWAGCFLPRFASETLRAGGKKVIELRDLGALGLEVALDDKGLARHSILSSKTDDKDLQVLVQYAINPDIVYSMDIEEVGELSWLQEIFVAASRGNQNAIRRIIESANVLTDGNFDPIWAQAQLAAQQMNVAPNSIVRDDQVRIPLGYYVDPNTQEQCDLRNIDYLALLNAVGEKDMTLVRRFQATTDNLNIPSEKRTEDRIKLIEEIVGAGRVHLTGYATRVSFYSHFLKAMNDAAVADGADIRPTNLLLDFSGNSGRSLYNLSALAVNPGQVTGVFSMGAAQGPGRNFVSGVHSRYNY